MSRSIFVGSVEVLPLLDAVLPNPVAEAAPGIDAAVLQAYPDLVPPDDTLQLPVTCYLIRSDGRTIMVDTGVGPRKRESWPTGRLHVALGEAGVLPADVDIVVNTHFHADHVGWNTVDDDDGMPKPWFTRARYLIQALEWAYWSRPSELARPGNVHVRQCILPLFEGTEVDIVGPAAAITSDVVLVPLPGHTPGHIGVGITSGSERAIVIGDASHYVAQLDHPDWSPAWDHDRARAAETRARLFDELEHGGNLAAASHWPLPGVGRVIRVGGRRIFAPA